MDGIGRPDRIIVGAYVALAVVALVATQVTLVVLLRDGAGDVVGDLTADPSVVFATLDLLLVAAAGLVFIVLEGRRIGLRRWWVYVVLTFAVAISVALPLFLAHRQLLLARKPG